MTIYRSRWVLPMSAPPVEDGAVAVDGDTIVAVGPAPEVRAAHPGEVHDLGDAVLSPGLINAHCHLDYTEMLGEAEWRGSFIEWILQMVALKKRRSEAQFATAVQEGIDLLVRSGTTTVVNLESFPSVITQAPAKTPRVLWFLELIDFQRDREARELVREAVSFAREHPVVPGGYGLSPHAPYTASAELYRLAAAAAREQGWLLTTHVAESEQEDDMFRRGCGSMHDYFVRAGRDMGDCKQGSVVRLLSERGVLGPGCLAVHANYLTPADMDLLARTGTPVVHCPKTHQFFCRGTPIVPLLEQRGIPVCLGTDSLASNDTLDLFAEMQELARVFPQWPAEELLARCTTTAARALGLESKLGCLSAGASADLIAVRFTGGDADPYEAVVYNEQPVLFSLAAGKVIVP